MADVFSSTCDKGIATEAGSYKVAASLRGGVDFMRYATFFAATAAAR